MSAVAKTNSESLLVVNNIEVIYDHVILVLKGVSLEVMKGGVVALLGANGAGLAAAGFIEIALCATIIN